MAKAVRVAAVLGAVAVTAGLLIAKPRAPSSTAAGGPSSGKAAGPEIL